MDPIVYFIFIPLAIIPLAMLITWALGPDEDDDNEINIKL